MIIPYGLKAPCTTSGFYGMKASNVMVASWEQLSGVASRLGILWPQLDDLPAENLSFWVTLRIQQGRKESMGRAANTFAISPPF